MKTTALSLIALFVPAALCAQIGDASAVSVWKARAKMDAARDAMIAGGRMHPSDEEVERSGWAMERGVTRAQIAAIARSTQGDRSLVAAYDVLAKLTANGVPAARAAAEIQGNVTSGASDATLVALLTADASAASPHSLRRTVSSVGGAGGDTPMLSTAVSGAQRRP